MNAPNLVFGWRQLPAKRKRQVVERLARRLMRDWPESLDRWGVVSVGFGWRVKESQRRVLRAGAPVLTLVVARKKKKQHLSAERLIPRAWPVTVRTGKLRHRVAVPIDVCRQGPDAHAHAPRLAPTAGADGRDGTACVVLSNSDSGRWVLGCHHVIGDSSVDPNIAPRPTLPISFQGFSGMRSLGRRRYFGPLGAGRSDCVDAAVVQIRESDPVTGADWGKYPKKSAPKYSYWETVLGTVQLLTRRGLMDMKFIGLRDNLRIQYLSGAWAGIREVALFEVTDAVLRPIGGDSGAPALASGGEWVGMHIAGNDEGLSVVIPSFVLLDSTVFGMTVQLSY